MVGRALVERASVLVDIRVKWRGDFTGGVQGRVHRQGNAPAVQLAVDMGCNYVSECTQLNQKTNKIVTICI